MGSCIGILTVRHGAVLVQVEAPSGPIAEVHALPVVGAVPVTSDSSPAAVLLVASVDHVDVTHFVGQKWNGKYKDHSSDAAEDAGERASMIAR
ncbi:DNA-directed RNA polymerase [Apiospora arundinis]